MSGKDGKGQNLPKKFIGLMLLNGFVLAGWLLCGAKERRENQCQQPGPKTGKDLPRVPIVLMLLSGIALVVGILFIPGERLLGPGSEIITVTDGQIMDILRALQDVQIEAVKVKLLSLVFASMILADAFLKYDAPAKFEKNFATVGTTLLIWAVAFILAITTINESLWGSLLALFTTIPLLIALVGPRMRQIRPLGRKILISASGFLTYLGAYIVAVTLSVATPGESVGTLTIVILGVIGILGLAVALGVFTGVLVGKWLGARPPRP